MSWGAFNICSEDHAIHHNADEAGGARYAVRYPYLPDVIGPRLWSSPMGSALDIGRCGRSWRLTSWMYERDESPSPIVNYEKSSPTVPNPAIHLSEIGGYDVSDDGPYYGHFYPQCNRLWIAQNVFWDGGNLYESKPALTQVLQPAKVSKSNVLAQPSYYERRPYTSPSMPNAGSMATKRGMAAWVRNGWAYKKYYPVLNDRPQCEFDFPEEGDGEWENDSIWAVSPNPAYGLDKNLLYMVKKIFAHGPNCNGTHNPFTSRYCNDRKLVGFEPHYWCKTAPPPVPFSLNALLKSWCVQDGYPYITGDSYYGYKCGWAPYSISCGKSGAFAEASRRFTYTDVVPFAKTDISKTSTGGPLSLTGWDALAEKIPARTAFDLVIYLEVINFKVRKRATREIEAILYFNTKCHAILHQIAPLPPKP